MLHTVIAVEYANIQNGHLGKMAISKRLKKGSGEFFIFPFLSDGHLQRVASACMKICFVPTLLLEKSNVKFLKGENKMKELLNQINTWTAQKKQMALARVIQTWGSSPRPVGSSMLITADMEMAGSVSGGCVEGAVLKESRSIFGSSQGKRLSYGVTDDDAWAVGLSCGGKIQVYLQPWGSSSQSPQGNVFTKLVQLLAENKSCVLVTVLSDHENKNTWIK